MNLLGLAKVDNTYSPSKLNEETLKKVMNNMEKEKSL